MHQYTVSQTLQQLHSNASMGLSDKAVEQCRQQHGSNTLPTQRSVSLLVRFGRQFQDLMIIILLVSAVISLVLSIIDNDTLVEPLIIVAIVLVNAILGTLQQYKADKALSQLSTMTSANATVLRNGTKLTIESSQLVVGDIVLLTAGQLVSADCRIIQSNGLLLDEASLTGESLPIAKDNCTLPDNTPLALRTNCVYSGSSILCGSATAVVYAVGVDTEIGTIASMISSKPSTKTPLGDKLAQLSKIIGIVCLAVCALVFVVGLIMGIVNMGSGDKLVDVFMDIFMTSVSLAVAAIPEGLPAIVTLVLARGVQRMASKNVIIKNLTAVETLGSATVICTDKTGTLTTGQMSLESIVTSNGVCALAKLGAQERQHLAYACMCCDATIGSTSYGDPTELAIVRSGNRLGIGSGGNRVHEIPFDSTRKKMTVVVSDKGKLYAITKGALDNMLSSSDNADYWQKANNTQASQGKRVLALSVRQLSDSYDVSSIEDNCHIVALLVISDTIKERVCHSVAQCIQAGIRPVMITGDSLPCAVSLATAMGIYRQGDMAVDGAMLADMSDSQLDAKICHIAVYARVTPSDKLRIVEAWQRSGAVTAMTGDGVNDSPALHRADIGCAMGRQGTDVAKESADMILVDDNFATIVDAVAEGRTVYNNIVKSVFYLLSCNIGEVLCVLLALILYKTTPLVAMQLLWVNLVTDGLPSLAIGLDKGSSMLGKPTSRQGFFGNGRGKGIALYGVLIAVITIVAYGIGNGIDASSGATMAFLVLSVSQLLLALEVRCDTTLLRDGTTVSMLLAVLISLILVALVALVPIAMSMFELVYLPMSCYYYCIALAILPAVCSEIAFLVNNYNKKQNTVD